MGSGKLMSGLSIAYSRVSRWVNMHRRTLGLLTLALSISSAIEYVRFALFGTRISWEVTLVFAPVIEDALKLGLVLYFLCMLTLANLSSDAAPRPKFIQATRIMFILCPMIAGCIVALFEPLSLNRFLSHMASVGLGFATCLLAWRRWKLVGGFLFGLAVGALVHSFLNTAYYWPVSPTGRYQFVAALVLLISAIWILRRASRQEPASDMVSELFPSGTKSKHTSDSSANS